jgi:preprotein translocase subunit SecE
MAKTVAIAEQTTTGMQSLKNQPKRLIEHLKEVRSEMRKVWWPGWPEVQSTTVVVLITVFLFAGYFWLIDNIIGRAIEALLHALTGS